MPFLNHYPFIFVSHMKDEGKSSSGHILCKQTRLNGTSSVWLLYFDPSECCSLIVFMLSCCKLGAHLE
jgi:hypothetical protein